MSKYFSKLQNQTEFLFESANTFMVVTSAKYSIKILTKIWQWHIRARLAPRQHINLHVLCLFIFLRGLKDSWVLGNSERWARWNFKQLLGKDGWDVSWAVRVRNGFCSAWGRAWQEINYYFSIARDLPIKYFLAKQNFLPRPSKRKDCVFSLQRYLMELWGLVPSIHSFFSCEICVWTDH